ncbi:MAG: hypothetical protein HXN49_02300, partial [Prevotella nanceiensis]|nr:hypothetical protein [Hoylesella nanceiensis]
MSKKRYIQGFLMVVVLLAIVKCVFPGIASNKDTLAKELLAETDTVTAKSDSVATQTRVNESNISLLTSKFFNADGSEVKHRIYSVPSYKDAFPDQNDVQLLSAQKYGVPPVTNREEAETRKSELVYVGSNPYFYVETLKQSIPYL